MNITIEAVKDEVAKKPIPDFEDCYTINELGVIVNLKTGKPLKHYIYKKKYPKVSLCKNGKYKNKQIHVLLAELFIPNPENKPFVNHKDGNKCNYELSNLEWCTYRENTDHAIANGLTVSGDDHHSTKISDAQIPVLIEEYNSGVNCVKLAKKYNVHHQTVYLIIARKSRTEITKNLAIK